MSNLFGIAQKYDYLVSQIEENDGEITEEIAGEIGLDFRTFKNRLNLDVTYYKENTKDQIMGRAAALLRCRGPHRHRRKP